MAQEPHFETYTRQESREVEEGPPGATYSTIKGAEYGWRFQDANGKITMIGGEGFTRREDAVRAIQGAVLDVKRSLGIDDQSAVGSTPTIIHVDE